MRSRIEYDDSAGTRCCPAGKGFKNGELLRAAEPEFDALVTLDDHLPDQQNIAKLDLAVAILKPASKRLEDLSTIVPELERVLRAIGPGEIVRIASEARS